MGTVHHSKVCCIVCVCDPVACTAVPNFGQFNGQFGCGFCLEEGVSTPKGGGFVRAYPLEVNDELPTLRTHAETLVLEQFEPD